MTEQVADTSSKAGTGKAGQATTHYLVLDAVRGFAAIAVLVYHLQFLFGGTTALDGSFLAVDLFFVMSGLVVALSYDGRLLSGEMSLWRFIQVRMIRLFPLYLAGCALGLAYQLGRIVMGMPDALPLENLAAAMPYVLLVLPVLNAQDLGVSDFPFTPTAWSLSLEFWFNIVYAIIVVRWRSVWLIPLALASFVVLCVEATRFNSTDLGWGVYSMVGGMARFWFSFTAGVLLFRWMRPGRTFGSGWLVLIPLTFVFIFLPAHDIVVQLIWIALVFPAFVFASAHIRIGGVLAKISDHLGRLSYGVYILHGPVVLLTLGAAKAVLGDAWEQWSWAIGLAIVPVVMAVTAALTYWFDEPLRRWLRRLGRAPRVRSEAKPTT